MRFGSRGPIWQRGGKVNTLFQSEKWSLPSFSDECSRIVAKASFGIKLALALIQPLDGFV
jgi:hypothetical protein